MEQSIIELAKQSKGACYINSCVFYARRDFDWLKPYVLLYDNILLDGRHGCSFQGAEARQNSEIWSWFEQNALFLEDFEELPYKDDIAPQSNPLYLPSAVTRMIMTKEGYFNKTFLAGFRKRVRCRNGGATDWARAFDVWEPLMLDVKPNINDKGAAGGVNTILLWSELASASNSFQLSMTGKIPSVLDPLSSWLVALTFKSFTGEELLGPRFKRILLRHVPDFQQLPWYIILELRESRHRKACLQKLCDLSISDASSLRSFDSALWKLVSDACEASKVGTTILKGIGGNLPIPPVNPVGIGLAIADAFQSMKIQKQFGWVFYVDEIKRAQESIE